MGKQRVNTAQTVIFLGVCWGDTVDCGMLAPLTMELGESWYLVEVHLRHYVSFRAHPWMELANPAAPTTTSATSTAPATTLTARGAAATAATATATAQHRQHELQQQGWQQAQQMPECHRNPKLPPPNLPPWLQKKASLCASGGCWPCLCWTRPGVSPSRRRSRATPLPSALSASGASRFSHCSLAEKSFTVLGMFFFCLFGSVHFYCGAAKNTVLCCHTESRDETYMLDMHGWVARKVGGSAGGWEGGSGRVGVGGWVVGCLAWAAKREEVVPCVLFCALGLTCAKQTHGMVKYRLPHVSFLWLSVSMNASF